MTTPDVEAIVIDALNALDSKDPKEMGQALAAVNAALAELEPELARQEAKEAFDA